MDIVSHPALLIVLLLAGSGIALEAGYWAGRFCGPRSEKFEKQLSLIQNAIFALVAFLIGFSFSGAGSRHVDRLDVVVREANALSKAWLYADMLAEPSRGVLKETVREYMLDRLEMLSGASLEETRKRLAKVAPLHARMWQAAVDGTRKNDSLMQLLLPAVSEVIELHAVHLSAARRGIPDVIMVALLFGAALSLGIAAFSNGQQGHRYPILNMVYGSILSIALWMTIDLDHPTTGVIRANLSPLHEALSEMPPQR